jgi:hypothetical protein
MTPLLNKRLLQETLSKNKHTISQSEISNLQTFADKYIARIGSKNFKSEESEKQLFLNELLTILGYVHGESFEFESKTDEGQRSGDAFLGSSNDNQMSKEIAVEWKGLNANLDKGKESAVSQLFDYMSRTKAEIGIVGNFGQWRLYTWNTKQEKYHEFSLLEISQSKEKAIELLYLLSPSFLLKGTNSVSPLHTFIATSEREQTLITKEFYKDFSAARLNLFYHICSHNQTLDKHILLIKTQKLLDRFVFILFCEDKAGLLPRGISKQIYELGKNSRDRTDQKIWREFRNLFQDIDEGRDDLHPPISGYNGGLFKQDNILDNLTIKDDIWENLISLAQYDFESDLNVNILGHIFEQSISDIEAIKADIDGTADTTKTSKRKKDGIYYTPEYITRYIVEQTVGRYLQEHPDKLDTIKVLDPACGSGAFPNQVFNYLSQQHDQKARSQSDNSNDIFATAEGDKEILKNNIFGVDLQPESVEIAKLSLWLKTARKDQKLANLDSNFKQGNSLIDDVTVAGENAFDWQKEFPQIFNFSFDINKFAETKGLNKTEFKLLNLYNEITLKKVGY